MMTERSRPNLDVSRPEVGRPGDRPHVVFDRPEDPRSVEERAVGLLVALYRTDADAARAMLESVAVDDGVDVIELSSTVMQLATGEGRPDPELRRVAVTHLFRPAASTGPVTAAFVALMLRGSGPSRRRASG